MLDTKTGEREQLTTHKFSPQLIVNGSNDVATGVVPALDVPFLIPIYQRLYTWETEHVYRLLEDLYAAAFSKTKDGLDKKANEYFIGALVTTREQHLNGTEALELIDGQQRLTTLWLIASVLVTDKSLTVTCRAQWQEFLAITEKPRLDFSGRETDIQALSGFVKHMGEDSAVYPADNRKWLKNDAMANARSTVELFFKESQFDVDGQLQKFSDYIWLNATFVITQLHQQTDKERFFDTMNSRGVQLEKHEILKALMLTNLDERQRAAYAKAWDLCADIDGYIPGPLQKVLNYGITTLNEQNILAALSPQSAQKNPDEFELYEDAVKGVSLKEIVALGFSVKKINETPERNAQVYKSPVAFPVFLLHALRVFVENGNPSEKEPITLDDKKLVEVFERFFKGSDEQLRMRFIETLLECRLLLDNFVIKGLQEEASERANWQILSRLADRNTEARTKFTGKTWASISMLQAMMHFSPMNGTQRASWLTETLQTLRELRSDLAVGNGAAYFLLALQQQDFVYGNEVLKDKTLQEAIGADTYKGKGTNVHHYWFYKLEYCLWELWYNDHVLNSCIVCEKPKVLNSASFRMRSVGSIEHVSPQSQNNGVLTGELLDRFGNLALISVGENSTYSDKDPVEKKGVFVSRLNKSLIQSLKLAHIFDFIVDQKEDWNDKTMEAHEEAMVAVLQAFYGESKAKNNNDAGAQG
jgi:hypothetical protein